MNIMPNNTEPTTFPTDGTTYAFFRAASSGDGHCFDAAPIVCKAFSYSISRLVWYVWCLLSLIAHAHSVDVHLNKFLNCFNHFWRCYIFWATTAMFQSDLLLYEVLQYRIRWQFKFRCYIVRISCCTGLIIIIILIQPLPFLLKIDLLRVFAENFILGQLYPVLSGSLHLSFG